MNIGTEFENDLADEFGINRVGGSGNQWHNKLDLVGNGFRWSLKATGKSSIAISVDTLDEAIGHCEGSGGDGSIPIWAFRIGDKEHDIIALRKDDFKRLQAGELNIINSSVPKQVEERRAKASKPTLMRDDN